MKGAAPNASGLTVSATAGDAPAGWDHDVLEAGGTTFHSSAMGAAAIARGQDAWYLRVQRDGRTVALAVGAGIRSRTRILRRPRKLLEFQTMPLLTGEGGATLAQAVSAIRVFARSEGFGQVHLSSYADVRPEETPTLEAAGLTLAPRLEFRVPLAADFEATLAGMSVGHRRNIRSALTTAFEFIEDTSLEGAMLLRELQETTYGRRHRQGNLSARAWAVDDYETVMRAYLAQGAIRFWFVRREGRTLSGVGIMTLGPWAYYFLGGTNQEGYGCGAVFALFGHLIPYLASQGVTELNLGGMAVGAEQKGHIEHGLYRFKTGFGARVVRCFVATGST